VASGKIIFTSSVHDIIPWNGFASYVAAKGGLLMLMKSMALEVARQRIRVNAVSPGAIRTDINKEAWDEEHEYLALMDKVPYNRVGEVMDVGRTVAWLASDQADYITGVTLYVDGGMTLYPSFETGG
jgi:glucose 1-dehydrogenase